MPTALVALGAFIVVIIVLNVVLKRNMGEAMLVGMLVTAMFAGADAFQVLLGGLRAALEEEVLYAAMAFVFMAYVVDRTGLIHRLLEILNSVFGRVRGGPALVDTAGSAIMGAFSGSNSGNTAATGAFTGPWMVRSGFGPERSATILAGNGGFGAALPPSASMVIMIGSPGRWSRPAKSIWHCSAPARTSCCGASCWSVSSCGGTTSSALPTRRSSRFVGLCGTAGPRSSSCSARSSRSPSPWGRWRSC